VIGIHTEDDFEEGMAGFDGFEGREQLFSLLKVDLLGFEVDRHDKVILVSEYPCTVVVEIQL
jgi:hypothetical protein